ncbi:hypothetical protein KK062_13180 [Fulvivirgaceae bacterium PWU5]|uniref:Uncharacterized protein n=1 Tax=Dawidia cretensis TaxID=2782350 RepID=A0AAP2DZN0_9BACT|nr:hypothetical protein [Dawidia cretensis]MBT1709188.1 hypothetical protein [Dawidia cretensis]
MKTKDAKTKKSNKQKPAATTKDKQAHQKPQANDGAPDHTPEPPQMMHPLSSEERERKKDKSQ